MDYAVDLILELIILSWLRRERKFTFATIEDALALWAENALQAGLIITVLFFQLKPWNLLFCVYKGRFKRSDESA